MMKEENVTLKHAVAVHGKQLKSENGATALRAVDMTYKLLDAYPRRRVADQRHAHIHLAVIRDLEELPEGELEAIIEAESSKR